MKTKTFYKLTSIILTIMLIMSCICPTLSVSAASDSVAISTDESTKAAVTNGLTVTATSNLFPSCTQKLSADETQVTVTYTINCSKDMLNTQWELTYDPAYLAFNKNANLNSKGTINFMPQVTSDDLFTYFEPGVIRGNVSDLGLYSLSNDGPVTFVTVTFDVVGSGSTTVDLSLYVLNVSVLGDDFITDESQEESIVDSGVVQEFTVALDTATYVYSGTYNPNLTPPVETVPATEIDVNICGDINLELKSDGTNFYSDTIYLDAGTYQFKINDNGVIKGFGFTFVNEFVDVKYSSSYLSSTTFITSSGYYTFTYNITNEELTVTSATKSLTVTGDMELCGKDWDYKAFENLMLKEDDIYTITYKSVQPAKRLEFKIVEFRSLVDPVWHGDENGNNIIFNTIVETDVTITYDPSTQQITVTGYGVEMVTEIEIESMRAVGNGQDNWLNGMNWYPNADENLMTEIAEDVYSITYKDIEASEDYQVKFAANGSWADNWGGVYEGSGIVSEAEYSSNNNITFDVPYELADVTLTLDLSDFNYLTKTGAKFTVTIEDKTVYQYVDVVGDISLSLTNKGSGIYSGKTKLDKGTYAFKINENGTEMGFGYTFTDSITGLAYSATYKTPTTINATGGYYTFTYNINTNTLTVAYESNSTEPINLTVTATSNYFPETSTNYHYNSLTNELTVTYLFSCEKDILDTQWHITYDSEILTLSEKNNTNTLCPEMYNSSLANFNIKDIIYFQGSNLSLFDYSTEKVFAQVIFDVNDLSGKSPLSTYVDLYVDVLRVSALDNDTLLTDPSQEVILVNSGTIQDNEVTTTRHTKLTESSEPTTEPETQPATAVPPTTQPAVKDELTVNTTSNLFTSQSATYDSKTKKLTVTYWIQSTKDMLNTQWEMTYDPDVLTVSKDKNTANSVCPNFKSGRVLTINEGIIKFNALNLSLFDISSDETIFAKVVFDVKDFEGLTTNNTTIDLNIINLTVSSLDSSTSASDENEEVRVVYNSKYDDSYGLIVSEKVEMINAEIPAYIGDTDGSDIIDIHDATLISKYLADLKELKEEQLLVSDCDGDGIVCVKDVTCIQLYLADAVKSGNTGQKYN